MNKCYLCGHEGHTEVECKLNHPIPNRLLGLGESRTAPAKSGARKADSGKLPMSLLDRFALESIAGVLAFGAQKYAAHNWRQGLATSRLLDAALRHTMAYADGEDNDPESGLSHLAHAACCLMFLMRTARDKPELDDRHTTEQQS